MARTFQTLNLKTEYINKLDWRLRDLIVPFVSQWAERDGYQTVVTSVYRKDGIHETGRAVDLDFPAPLGVTDVIADQFGALIATRVNTAFKFGLGLDGRPREVALFHENRGSAGFHLHLQVPDGDLVVRRNR